MLSININNKFSLTENQGVFKEVFENCKFQGHFKRPWKRDMNSSSI